MAAGPNENGDSAQAKVFIVVSGVLIVVWDGAKGDTATNAGAKGLGSSTWKTYIVP